MEMGFWLNYRTGKEFRIDEHEQWIRKWTNAKKLGIPKDVYSEMIDNFELREDRDKMLLWLMSRTPIMRVRGHGTSVSFEFGSESSKKPLESIWIWGEDYAGDYTHLHITNFKKKKVVNILFKDFKKYFDEGREDAIMEEKAENIRILKSFKQFVEDKQLNESSLSRLYKSMFEHDTGVVTAYRSKEYDDDGKVVKTYTKKENQKRNADLYSVLKRLGYKMTSVHATCIENYKSDKAEEVREASYFVVDVEDKGKLRKDLELLGNKYNQDSILYIPKIKILPKADGLLIGTKKDKYSNKFAYPKYKQVVKQDMISWGEEKEFMTKIGNRPFALTESESEYMDVGHHRSIYLMACEVAKTINENLYQRVKEPWNE